MILSIVLFSCGKEAYLINHGTKEIGNFWEAKEYSAKYYVNINPEDERYNSYRLPAELYVYNKSGLKSISVKKVFFPNGGFLLLRDCVLEEDDFSGFCRDQDGRYWSIQLIKEKVE